jgi:hypothetical protein
MACMAHPALLVHIITIMGMAVVMATADIGK